jgi:multidrug efflux pump subunit AcrA (membrane-fusion protein)
MRTERIVDLAECTTFRQTLLARPPRIVHGTALLLTGLLGTGLAWAALTPADRVVRATGRVRPLATPKKVFSAVRAEVLSASTGGRVIEVHFREGDQVKEGALLLRLDVEHLDKEIAKQRQTIQAVAEELANLRQLEALTARQFAAARARAAAELDQAQEEVAKAKEVRTVEIRLARVELARARDEESRVRKLVPRRAAAKAELVTVVARLREAEAKLARARLPVPTERVQVAQRAREQVEQDHAVKQRELVLKRQVKDGELAAARIVLASREQERRQAEIRAPIAGVVTKGDIKVGDVLEPGKAAVEIAPQTGFLFEAAVASEDVGHLRVGMTARIKLDAYDYQRYGTVRGTVCFVSPDSGVSEGQVQATYTVRITLASDEVGRGEYRGRVKLGMSGQVDIVTGGESLLVLLLQRLRQTISLG